ncbi:hypothetical protein Hanom_Chr06g00542041 [Helianthus anomalus]
MTSGNCARYHLIPYMYPNPNFLLTPYLSRMFRVRVLLLSLVPCLTASPLCEATSRCPARVAGRRPNNSQPIKKTLL